MKSNIYLWGSLALLVTWITTGVAGYQIADHQWQARYTKDSTASAFAIQALRTQTAKIDTLFVRDTLTVTQTVARWRERTDTLHLTDSVLVPGPVVREIVREGDSVVAACSALKVTCEAQRQALSRLADSVTAENVRLKKAPPRLGCTVGVTYTVGDLTDHRRWDDWVNRAGITCGLRLHLFGRM